MSIRLHFNVVSNDTFNEMCSCKTIEDVNKFFDKNNLSYNADAKYYPLYMVGETYYRFDSLPDFITFSNYCEKLFEHNSFMANLFNECFYECEDDCLIVTKEAVRYLIESIIDMTKDYYETIYKAIDSSNDEDKRWALAQIDSIATYYRHDFGLSPVDLDENDEQITHASLWSMMLFELTRFYKTFDFENNKLLLLIW